jgi:two-component system, chemotaxis family, chemotaxis protein CheY
MSADTDLNSVIVADNDLQLRSILRSLFVTLGFDVLLASDGLEALDYARSTAARLIVLDKKMPNMDGLQVCVEIRGLPGYAEIPIIVLTVYDDEPTRTAAIGAGATMFLAKPFRPDELMQAIAPLLGIKATDRSSSFIWKRRTELSPVRGDAPELSQGRKMLNIYRRGPPLPNSTR